MTTIRLLGAMVLCAMCGVAACSSAEECHTLTVTAQDGSTTTYQGRTSARIRVQVDGSQLRIELPEGHTEEFRPHCPCVNGQSRARTVSSQFASYSCQ